MPDTGIQTHKDKLESEGGGGVEGGRGHKYEAMRRRE